MYCTLFGYLTLFVNAYENSMDNSWHLVAVHGSWAFVALSCHRGTAVTSDTLMGFRGTSRRAL